MSRGHETEMGRVERHHRTSAVERGKRRMTRRMGACIYKKINK